MTRILLIPGSTREDSLHVAALRTAARLAPAGSTATLYDGLRDLPAFVPGQQPMPGAVAFLRPQVEAADAVLFSTPEYAGSLPGSLKNLLDWLVAGGSLDGKPVAWLSVAAPGQDDGARATLETALEHARARLLRSACVRIPLSAGCHRRSGPGGRPAIAHGTAGRAGGPGPVGGRSAPAGTVVAGVLESVPAGVAPGRAVGTALAAAAGAAVATPARGVDQAAIAGSSISSPAQMRVELCEWKAAPE
jgi:chromate reductase